jgi:hypothetical protein
MNGVYPPHFIEENYMRLLEITVRAEPVEARHALGKALGRHNPC